MLVVAEAVDQVGAEVADEVLSLDPVAGMIGEFMVACEDLVTFDCHYEGMAVVFDFEDEGAKVGITKLRVPFVKEDEVIVGGLLKALLEPALGVDGGDDFPDRSIELLAVVATEKASSWAHLCFKRVGGFVWGIDGPKETFDKCDLVF